MKTYLSIEQISELHKELQSKVVDIDKFYLYFNIKHLHELTIPQYEKAMRALSQKPLKDINDIVLDDYKNQKDDANKEAMSNLLNASKQSLGASRPNRSAESTVHKRCISREQANALNGVLKEKLIMPDSFAREVGYRSIGEILDSDYMGALLKAKGIGFKNISNRNNNE